MWGEDVIQIMYDVPNHRIQVWKFEGKAWVQVGNDIPVKFVDGDVFTVFAGKDGTVEITRNGRLLSTRQPAVLQTPTPTVTETPIQKDASAPELANFALVGLKLPAPYQQSGSLIIDYTYDPLNRLASADYSDGRSFDYTYDASGNVLELGQNLGPGTIITTYTYDEANQLNTAQQDSTTWQYTYDANGSLISDGVKNYTYDSANRLVQVSDQSTVTSLSYNGLGQRLSMDAAGVIATYVLDGDRPLTAESNGNTTFYLYGLGAIGEKTTEWNFSLPDGTNTPRQLTDIQGEITLSARYTPWGDTLETYGTGNFSYGYLGGLLDAATGLLYVGNGQYYDPSTGRFLTRDVYPNSPNPYVPWNPIGAILAPLALISLFYTRKRKGSKTGTFLVLLIVLGGVGMTLAACGPVTTPTAPAPNPTPVPTSTPDDSAPAVPPSASPPWGPATIVAIVPIATASPVATPTPTCTPTPTLVSTPISVSDFSSILLSLYGVELQNSSNEILGTWNQRLAFNAWRAVTDVANRLGGALRFREAFYTIGQNLVLRKVESYIEYLSGNVQVPHNNGAITRGTHLVEIADIEYQVEDSIRNNIVHELGHVFNNNHGNPAETIMPFTFVERRKEFLRPVGDDGVMWQLHPPLDNELSTETETFADMFVAHVYYAWVNPSRISPDPQKWMEDIVR